VFKNLFYEKPLGKGVLTRSYKRADAFYGLRIFEYKTPKIDLVRSAKERVAKAEVFIYL